MSAQVWCCKEVELHCLGDEVLCPSCPLVRLASHLPVPAGLDHEAASKIVVALHYADAMPASASSVPGARMKDGQQHSMDTQVLQLQVESLRTSVCHLDTNCPKPGSSTLKLGV